MFATVDSTIDSLKTLIDDADQDTTKARLLRHLADFLRPTDPLTAHDYAHEAYQLAIQTGCIEEKVEAAMVLGRIYSDQGDYEKATGYYLQSQEIYEELEDKKGTAQVYNNLGVIYASQKILDKALEYYFKSLEIRLAIDDTVMIGFSYNNIGTIYSEMKKHLRALEYFEKAMKLFKKYGNERGLGVVYNNMGEIFKKENMLDKAADFYQKSLALKRKGNNKRSLSITLNNLAEVSLRTGDIGKSRQYAQESIRQALAVGSRQEMKTAYETLSLIAEKEKDYRSALKYFKAAAQIGDSLSSDETIQAILHVEMQHEFDLKQKQYEFEQRQAFQEQEDLVQRQKLILFLVLTGLVSSLLLVFMVYRSARERKQANALLNEQKIELQSEKSKSDNLLLNILPAPIAEELKKKGKASFRRYEAVSVMFADFQNFTGLCEYFTQKEIIEQLDRFFIKFDTLVEKYNLEKIKTIGDAYLCAGGVPEENNSHPVNSILAAFEFQHFITLHNLAIKDETMPRWRLRIGIHTGPVAAGVVGMKKFAYDIWGDTVNIAARVETTGEVDRVNISGATFELIKDYFVCTHRGKIEAKNKGLIDMYFVDRLKPEFSENKFGNKPNNELRKIIKDLN